MRLIPIDKLIELQSKPDRIRNICILAHVDHGKTTLADSLVASNGIISARMVGKMRYMDNLPEEQERGITMKSSAIALYYTNGDSQYLINLIDSPGHVDFCGEVSTAVRLCDSALIIVDVVEGVCPQTHAVLRQAWKEGLKPLLVLNKLDRLILELKMNPLEMYKQLLNVLGQVNAVAGELFMSKVLEMDEKLSNDKINTDNNASDKNGDDNNNNNNVEEVDILLDDEHLYFTPENGNVVFASAYDGWGFRIEDFAKIWSTKANLSEKVLKQTLWGDFYLDSKTKRVKRGAFAKGKKPLFVQMILDNVWSMYDAFVVRKDKAQAEKIVSSLNLHIAARDARHQDARIYAQAAFQQWLPLAGAVLTAVCEKTPSPSRAVDDERAVRLMCGTGSSTYGNNFDSFENLHADTRRLKSAFANCSPDHDAPTIVLVSKLFAVETKHLPTHRTKPMTVEEIQERRKLVAEKRVQFNNEVTVVSEENIDSPQDVPKEQPFTFLAFCRVFSGVLRRNQTLYVLPPTHDPALVCTASPEYLEKLCKFHVGDMYLMMGRELEAMPFVPAGNVAALAGLEDLVLKSATLSDDPMCPAFSAVKFYAEPIVRVSVEPKHAADMSALQAGLKLLNQADPCVKTYVDDTGEQVLVTAGEVHLQRCVNDLQERYSKIELNISEPIIPFMETVVVPPTLDRVNETIQQQGSSTGDAIEIKTSNKQVSFRIRALPLPEFVIKLLDRYDALLKLVDSSKKLDRLKQLEHIASETSKQLDAFRKELSEAFDGSGVKSFKGACDRIWSFGPKKARCNILLNNVNDYDRSNVWDALSNDDRNGFAGSTTSGLLRDVRLREYDQSVVSGFQMRCRLGPLCEEPIRGVAFVVEDWRVEQQSMTSLTETGEFSAEIVANAAKDAYGPLSGQIIACVKEGCKLAFQAQPQRLVAAMYSCVIQATTDVLGRVYAVLSKRGGRVLGEEMKEGANLFEISATLPVVESFGFCDEIRKRTSGLASPQLVFSHWEVIDIDPFWVPTTAEELSHFGEKADSENRARKYMNAVRKRKGLSTDEKIVEFGTKQRTLTIK